jgi:hypothetical protein
MPLDVHAPLAALKSEFVHLRMRINHTQNGTLSAEVGHYWLLSGLWGRFGDNDAGNHEEAGEEGGDRNHDYKSTEQSLGVLWR